MLKYFTYLFFLLYVAFMPHSMSAQALYTVISAPEFKQQIESNTSKYVIDVRTQAEYNTKHIIGAQNIDMYQTDFLAVLKTLDINKPIYIYCLSGARSSISSSVFKEAGFKKIYELQGGLMNWENYQYAVKTEKESQIVPEITLDIFEKLLSTDTLVMVDVYAPWCLPCKTMSPLIEEVSNEYKSTLKLIKLNADIDLEVYRKLNVESIPALLFYINHKLVMQHIGVINKDGLVKLIKTL